MTVARLFLFALLLGTSALAARAQEATQDRRPDASEQGQAVPLDSGRVDVRAIPPEALRPFRNDPDFAYDRQAPPANSWWGRLLEWLDKKLYAPLWSPTGNLLIIWTLRILAALGLIYVILKMLRMEPRGLFYGRSDRRRPAFAEIEDIQDLDFDKLISEAVAARDFRQAVRWLYLGALKNLADRDLIRWQPEKTNHEYLRELGAEQAGLAAPFDRLTYLFEYIWYGDFDVDEAAFRRAQEQFAAFSEKLGEAAAYA